MSGTFEQIRRRNQELRDSLLALTKRFSDTSSRSSQATIRDADAIVAHIEINDHHGVGVLLQRLFGDSANILSIRSKDFYGGKQDFGAMQACIAHNGASRDLVTWEALEALRGATVRRILAVPYFEDDALNAIALKEVFGVPLCTFLMDDQNLYSDGISDTVMGELLKKSSLRLAISPQMCAGYEAKYGCRVDFMPPLAPARLMPRRLNEIPMKSLPDREPLILGNIWGQHWLQLLREAIRGTGITVRWYNNGDFRWMGCSNADLRQDGILPQEGPPDPDETLVEILRQSPFVIVPSGTLDEKDDRRFIARLSFPSRIPYILATSHTPVLVLGSEETAAARAVTHLGIGAVAPYQPKEFLKAVEHIRRPEVNLAMRRAAFRLSSRFGDLGAAEWIWQSLEKGAPADKRYEDLMPRAEPQQRQTKSARGSCNPAQKRVDQQLE